MNRVNFAANAYYASGSSVKIQWGSKTYTGLAAWRSGKSQEKYNGVATGFEGNPKLSAAGAGGTIANPDALSGLSAYRLSKNSPVINKGVPIDRFLSSLAPDALDFYGEAGLRGGKFDMGIDEVR